MISHTAPRFLPLRTQALRRLVLITLLLVVGIAFLGFNNYHALIQKEVASRTRTLQDYYGRLLPETERTWQTELMQLRQRIEYARLIEPRPGEPAPARWTRLTSLLTAQSEFNMFPHLVVLNPEGEVVFRYGQEAEDGDGQPWARNAPVPWYLNRQQRDLYRVLDEPLWLGPGGEGRLIALKPIDAGLFHRLAVPQTALAVSTGGVRVTEGGAPIPEDRDGTGFSDGVVQVALPWPGTAGQEAPILTIRQVFHPAFPVHEFMLRPAAAMLLVLVLIALGLAHWLSRTARRIETVTGLLRAYQTDGHTPPQAEERLAKTLRLPDEIRELGVALITMMHDADQRIEEQKHFVETLSLLDEAVIEFDCDGSIRRASPGWRHLAGSETDPVGQPFANFLHPGDAPMFKQMCLTFNGDEKALATLRLRLRLAGKEDDEGVWVEGRFTPLRDEAGRLGGGRGVLRDITQSYLQEQRIKHLALHDALTGLPNRILLEDRIKQALRLAHREGHKVAACFIDLDHFKDVNDTLGHKAGDRLLNAFAARMRPLLREGDSLARWGGDEFVFLLPDLPDCDALRKVLAKVQAAFKAAVTIDDTDFTLTFSMGAALYPDDGRDMDTLLAQADRALFYAKAQGRNQACLIGEIAAGGGDHKALYIQNRLVEAIHERRIQAWYQPLLDAQSGACIGAEVLARWQDAEEGWISPATFIPMAENLGLIGDLGEQILAQGLETLAHWRAQGWPLYLAVNVSRRQLFTTDLVTRLPERLARYGLAPADLALEVTESIATREAAHTIERLRVLDAAGFRIAVDDFGTGYSSLSELHELPVDELKIDQSFVRRIHEPAGRSMVEAILHIARSLNLRTVAEGVEDETTAALLRALDVHILQGYHFARPMPEDEFTRWLAQTRESTG